MALVAVAALAFGAEMTRRRGAAYAAKAAEHATWVDNCRISADQRDRVVAGWRQEARRGQESVFIKHDPAWTAERLMQEAARYAEDAKYERKLAAFHEKLRDKYRHAARYPWLPVEPDPPKPRRRP